MPPSDEPTPVDVCVLTYGDHPHLIRRCLDSLRPATADPGVRLHVGLNSASRATAEVVAAQLIRCPAERYFTYPRDPQAYKYPLMRQMLRAGSIRPDGILVWFDDDSFVKSDPLLMLSDLRRVFAGPDRTLAMKLAGVLQRYISLAPFQKAWVVKQPWHTGKPIPDRNVPLIPGSWWACPTRMLLDHDWPPPDMVHNGGDIMLSLLCQQQGYEMVHMPRHVTINADASGKNCSQPSREPRPRTPRAGDPAGGGKGGAR